MTKKEIRKTSIQAHNKIVQMGRYITKLEFCLTGAIHCLDAGEPGSEAVMMAAMIRRVVGNENLPLPPLRLPKLVVNNG